MKASHLTALVASLAVALLIGGATTTHADVPDAPEISGVVQDWRPDSGYMVVDGVRYEFGPDFVLRSDKGPGLPLDSVQIGNRVKFASYNGVVEVVTVVSAGTSQ